MGAGLDAARLVGARDPGTGIDVYFENVGGAIWQAVLALLNNFARVTVSGLIGQDNGIPKGDGPSGMLEDATSASVRTPSATSLVRLSGQSVGFGPRRGHVGEGP